MNKAHTFHSDPGHGWLEVEESDLASVKLHFGSFSTYSYYREHAAGTTLYLEEDCDAGKYLAAFKATHGAMPEIREQYHDSVSQVYNPIRRMKRIDRHEHQGDDDAWQQHMESPVEER